MHTSYHHARFTTGVKGDVVATPRIQKARPPIIYCHSSAIDGSEALGVGTLVAVRTITEALVAAGYTVGAPSLAALWGNATAKSRITDALTWLRANTLCTDDPAILIGTSMGATSALSWAVDNRSDTAGMIGVIPAVDVQQLRVDNPNGLRTSIDAAYGVTYPAALPAGSNPKDMNFTSLPIQLWTASDDPVSVNAASVATDHRNVGALNHTNTAVAAVDTEDVLSFIQALP